MARYKEYQSGVGVQGNVSLKTPTYTPSGGLYDIAARVFQKVGYDIKKEYEQQRKIDQTTAIAETEQALISLRGQINEEIASGKYENADVKYSESFDQAMRQLGDRIDDPDVFQTVYNQMATKHASQLIGLRRNVNNVRKGRLNQSIAAQMELNAQSWVGAKPVERERILAEAQTGLVQLKELGLITPPEMELRFQNYKSQLAMADIELAKRNGDFVSASNALDAAKESGSIDEVTYSDEVNKISRSIEKAEKEVSENIEVARTIIEEPQSMTPAAVDKWYSVNKQALSEAGELNPETEMQLVHTVAFKTGAVPRQVINRFNNYAMAEPEQITDAVAAEYASVAELIATLPPNAKARLGDDDMVFRAEFMTQMTALGEPPRESALRLAKVEEYKADPERREKIKAKVARLTPDYMNYNTFARFLGEMSPIRTTAKLASVGENLLKRISPFHKSKGFAGEYYENMGEAMPFHLQKEVADTAELYMAAGFDESKALETAAKKIRETADVFRGFVTPYAPHVVFRGNKNRMEQEANTQIASAYREMHPEKTSDEIDEMVRNSYLVPDRSTKYYLRQGDIENTTWSVYRNVEFDGDPYQENDGIRVGFNPSLFKSDKMEAELMREQTSTIFSQVLGNNKFIKDATLEALELFGAYE